MEKLLKQLTLQKTKIMRDYCHQLYVNKTHNLDVNKHLESITF